MPCENKPDRTALGVAATERHYGVGTLSYTRHGLWMLFFWLMWNDFTLMLMEQVTTLTDVLMKDRGASYTTLSLFALVSSLLGMWINPFFSTWSDRLRTPYGRRRPILFFAVPLFAASLALIPFMPDLSVYLNGIPTVSRLLEKIPVNGAVLFIGIGSIGNRLINAIVLAIFSYFYWDVVPESVLGRFNSIARIVTLGASLVWSFFIVGHAEHHPKAVYIGVSLFCLAVYVLSIWRVKEGKYPDPPKQENEGFAGAIKSYFDDCFRHSYYMWIFVGMLFFQIGNLGNNFKFFYLRNDLHLDLAATGWIDGIGQTFTAVFGLLCGYSAGAAIDRFKPIRVLPASFLALSLLNIASYFFICDKTTAAVFSIVNNMILFVFYVAMAAATVEFFPREKLGQFCSAQTFFYQTIVMVLNPLIVSPLFDYIQFNRLAYCWSGIFYLLAAAAYVKIYLNWKELSTKTAC
jgi:maltose/moltooligosaccharide transporter